MHRTLTRTFPLALLALPSIAIAQPEPRWFALGDAVTTNITRMGSERVPGKSLHVWHRDGPDKPPVLAVVQWVLVNGVQGNMATWDGERWEVYPVIPGGANAFGRSTLFDFDADGPEPERVVALRALSDARVVRWNGSEWEPLPGWIESSVAYHGAITSFDPDGEGPEPAMLVAGNQTVNVWNGSGWTQIGATEGPNPQIRILAMCGYDADGPGPGRAELFISGQFTSVSGVPADTVARWDGKQWHAVPGLDAIVNAGAFAIHDFDADGPALPELVFAADAMLGPTRANLFAWNGSTLRALVEGTFTGASSIAPTHVVSTPEHGLLVYGSFTDCAGRPVPRVGAYVPSDGGVAPLSTHPGAGFDDGDVHSIVSCDFDADGPMPPSLYALGTFNTSGGLPLSFLARWNGRQWQPVTGTFNDTVNAVAVIDPDGDGPQGERTYLGGPYETFAGVNFGGIAVFDGACASPMGDGPSASGMINAGTTLLFDPDADGPAPAGLFTSGASVQRWDGVSWHNTWNNPGVWLDARKMCVHDFDGDGPQPARLIAAGPSNAELGQILQYDGTTWTGIGGGIGRAEVSSGARAVLSHDHDADGPLPPYLYASGAFNTADGQSFLNASAYFDGKQWNPMGHGWGLNLPDALIDFDPDADGPRAVEIIAGGGTASSNPLDARGVSAWDGAEWHELGRLDNRTHDLALFDADGDGPGPARLIACGRFSTSDGVHVGQVAQWNAEAQQWEPLGSSPVESDGIFFAMGVERPFGPRGPQRLVAAGSFSTVNATPIRSVVRFTHFGAPWLMEEPADQAIEPGGTLTLRAVVSAAYAGAEYRWLRNGEEIAEGPGGASPGGGVVSGASGVLERRYGVELRIELTITSPAASDAGDYQLVIANAEGEATSRIARVSAGSACAADFNADGTLNTQDFFDFLSAFFAENPQADINNSGTVDSQDFFDFLTAFFNGC